MTTLRQSKSLVAALVLAAGLTSLPEAHAMFKTNVFSSPIKGQLLKEGNPISDIEVIRQIKGDGLPEQGHMDTSITNKNGQFEFQIIQNKSMFRPGFLTASPVVVLKLSAQIEGKTYTLFFENKMNFDLGGEGHGPVMNMRCDISKYEILGQYIVPQCVFEKVPSQ